jgi:hypothetical protein
MLRQQGSKPHTAICYLRIPCPLRIRILRSTGNVSDVSDIRKEGAGAGWAAALR